MNATKRFDAHDKLIGKIKYTDDYKDDKMLFGAIYFSPYAAGVIKDIKLPAYQKDEFIIVTAADITGINLVPEPDTDQQYLAAGKITHLYQPVLAVAGSCHATLKNFIKNIRLDIDETEAITSPLSAFADDKKSFGREILVDARHSNAVNPNWLFLEKTYYTPHQEQGYLEPQAMLAEYDEENKVMNIRGSMQVPYAVKHAVEHVLGNAISECVVRVAAGIGGAFGGKEDFPNVLAGICALLSYKAKKSVKIALSRPEDFCATTKRHPAKITIKSWTCPKTKKLKKYDIDYRLDAGGFLTISYVVLSRGVLHSGSIYQCDNSRIWGRTYFSNTPPNGAYRGFGAPQGLFAMECHIDDIAHAVETDPASFRLNNILKNGEKFAFLQELKDEGACQCLVRVLTKSDYYNKKKHYSKDNENCIIKKGIGVSIGLHGGGYTGNGEKFLNSTIKIRLKKDGEVSILVSNVEMGQGASTTLAQMVAEKLEYPLTRTKYFYPDTSISPNSGPTVASRTIYIVGNMLAKLAGKIRRELGTDGIAKYVIANNEKLPRTWEMTYSAPADVVFDEKTFTGTAYRDYSWAACVAEIEYNTLTMQVDCKKIWNVLDIGKVINHEIAEGQVCGGVMQATGYAISEFVHKENYGRFHGFTDYSMPTSVDAPCLDVEFINTDNPLAKGLGEIPMDYPAPAIRNAVMMASGIASDKIPLTAENLFAQKRC